jgi:hypothetical protein
MRGFDSGNDEPLTLRQADEFTTTFPEAKRGGIAESDLLHSFEILHPIGFPRFSAIRRVCLLPVT